MLTEADRERRRKYLGCSDLPAILGLVETPNARDVWMEKVYGANPATSEQMECGNLVEGPLIEWCGLAHVPGHLRVDPDYPPVVGPCGVIAVTPDAAIIRGCEDPEGLIEAKSSGQLGWGDDPSEGASAVPKKVIVQVAGAMYCLPSVQYALIPVLLGRFGLRRVLYRIERDELDSAGIIEHVARRGNEWWQRYVSKRVEPPESPPPALDTLKRLRRVPKKTVAIEGLRHIVACRDAFKARRLDLEKQCNMIDAELVARLGDAEAAYDPEDGEFQVTYFEHARKGYEVPPTKFRQIRVVKSKGGA